MNKSLYNLVVAGSLLFWASCSDEKGSPISGSTEVPNMSNSIVCSRVTANEADMQQTGCYWTAEMWNRNSGYRVRTGLDNGTNTSGIWTWSVLRENDHVDWPGNATAAYDSMALADVIDKCGGSLCGTAVFGTDDSNYRLSGFGDVSLEFAFAGKNASGNFDVADVGESQGICIEYFGENLKMELIVDENAESSPRAIALPDYKKTNDLADKKGYELCLPWNAFVAISSKLDQFISHLQGLRIKVVENMEPESYFEIISLGRYSYSNFAADLAHPVSNGCNVASVKSYFCDCSYSEERREYEALLKTKSYLNEKIHQKLNASSDVIPVAVEKCLKELNTYDYDDYIYETKKPLTNASLIWERPCENPLPQTFICADGSESESQEFSEMFASFENLVNVDFQEQKIIADSLFAQCLTLHDSLSDARIIPDSCRVDESFVERSVSSLNYARDAILESFNALSDSLTTLNSVSTLDDSTRYCVNAFIAQVNTVKDSAQPLISLKDMVPPIMLPQNKQIIVKTMTCSSGNSYYTDEYKEYLQELGVQDETDSIQVYNAVKRAYPHEVQKAFESCFEFMKLN